ncbi:T9SS type A sorting domain-containing protein [Pedobacter arcticus]|uniref:T9SS type A sorting domain-containing protein n=1 Tax=Pedobacter arcticus TaxID=752140 RepID=UPI0002F5B754|nr:T9SS type A sorting domain-containing protein [Pedobacter arcticus]
MKKLFTIILAVFTVSQLNAQIAAWNLYGKVGSEPTATPTVVAPNVIVSDLSRGIGLTAQTGGNTFASTLIPPNTQPYADMNAAIVAQAYYEFTITPKPGVAVNLSAINRFILRIQPNVASAYVWRYGKVGDADANFVNIGSPVILADIGFDFAANGGNIQPLIDLSGISDLQNISEAVIFRLYAWGGAVATSGSGSFRIGQSPSASPQEALSIDGTTVSLTEWNLNGIVGTTVNPPAIAQPTRVNPNIEVSALSRGDGVTAQNAGNAYSSAFPINADKAAAVAADSYYEFTITPKGNALINLSALNVILRVQVDAPKTYIWRYSKDNGNTFQDIGSPYTLTTTNFSFTDNNGIQQPSVDLSGITDMQQFNNPVIFRLYAWGGSSASSNNSFRIGASVTTTRDALTIRGEVVQMNTLPVVLSSFTAKKENNSVKLNWLTQSEQNNSHFQVLRSSDGNTPVVIGTVSGNGNSTSLHNYSFIDSDPLVGDNYYQLRQVDYDGKSTESSIVHINTGFNKTSLNISKLSENDIQLSVYAARAGKGKIQVVSIDGRKVYESSMDFQQGNNQIQIPVNANGMYIASFITAYENISTKFLK